MSIEDQLRCLGFVEIDYCYELLEAKHENGNHATISWVDLIKASNITDIQIIKEALDDNRRSTNGN